MTADSQQPTLSAVEWWAMIAISVLAGCGVWRHWWPLDPTEVLGFVSGGICVWLTARAHIWNFPIGLANNVFFFILFFRAALFADMTLQLIYFALGIYGWVLWVKGGPARGALPISRTRLPEWFALFVFVALGTVVMRAILLRAHGASPFWDGLTTALSLAAQYLLSRKRLEHWWLWMLADIIYVPLYLTRQLPLTAVLYGVFLLMCAFGLRGWLVTWRAREVPAT